MALGVGGTLEVRGLGAAEAPSRVQGQHPVGGPGGQSPREQNGFGVFTLAKTSFPESS